MRKIFLTMLCLAISCTTALAGEIYGTIKEGGKPIKAGTKVEVKCAKGSYSAETDNLGSYRLFVPVKGKRPPAGRRIAGRPGHGRARILRLAIHRKTAVRGDTRPVRLRVDQQTRGGGQCLAQGHVRVHHPVVPPARLNVHR